MSTAPHASRSTSSRRGSHAARFALPLVLAATASQAGAQWTAVDLHPPGAVGSRALGTRGPQQVGVVDGRAALWLGSAASFVDLGPGIAVATDGVRQLGNRIAPSSLPTLWSGTAASYTTLPSPYAGDATAMDATTEVGWYAHQFTTYVQVWENGVESGNCPAGGVGFAPTYAWGVDAGQVVGNSVSAGNAHAEMWTCGAGVTHLQPAGTAASTALGVHAGIQVGWTRTNAGDPSHACLWNGSASTWVDLHPAGASSSTANAVFGPLQVGYAVIGSATHATLWIGSASSAVDLHAYAPPGSTSSVATGVWTDANGTSYVSGWVTDATANQKALLWVGSVPAPRTFCFGDGSGAACPCANESPSGTRSGCLNTGLRGGQLTTRGVASVGADTLQLVGTGMPDSSILYFQGTTRVASGAGSAFGDGLRCAGGTIVRLGRTVNVAGTSSYPAGLDPAISVRGSDAPGDVRTYQAWYRNAAPYCTPSTFNTTNGVEVTWQP